MKRIISLAVFIVVAIITLWSTTMMDFSDEDLSPTTKSEQYIEIFMNDFEMTAMNEDGAPAYILSGKYLERYNDSDQTKIDQPIIHLLDADTQWLVSANVALLDDKKNTIHLKDNVVMQQQNIEPAVIIRTQSMIIHTKTQIAQTAVQVKITQGESQLTSIGMVYNNVTNELALLSRVSGFYLPQ